MAGRIPQSFIDDLLARTDIVGVIESRVPLKRAGRNWTACCPFHKEKTPSFTVSPDKQFYYCFGCGATGNALGFLMDYERRPFPEAVEELAGRAGLTVPHETGEDDGQQARFRALYEMLGNADRFFQEQLRKHAMHDRAVNYLKGRGLTGEIARRFGLGYAPPGWDNLWRTLGDDDVKNALLVDSGLLVVQDGKTYDRFRDRVMFPIRDARGRVIGFGGRVIGDGKPKYLNSPETPVFHKGRELYGLYEAKQATRQLERLLVVEGYMDVIALAQQGINNSVATLGTACTGDHVDLLFRNASEVVFCFDGDAAGRRAAKRALEATLPKMQDGRVARVLFLPPEHDPDSLVRERGADAFNTLLAKADSLDDVLLHDLSTQVDVTRTDGRARLAALAKPYLAQVPGAVLRSLMIRKLADLAQVDPRLLEPTPAEASAPAAAPARPMPHTRPRRSPPTAVSVAGHIVRRLLVAPGLAREIDLLPNLRGLDLPDVPLLFETLDILRDSTQPSVASLFGRLRGSEYEQALADLAGLEFLEAAPAGSNEEQALNAIKAELAGACRQLELAFWDAEYARELHREGGPDPARLRELTERLRVLKAQLQGHA